MGCRIIHPEIQVRIVNVRGRHENDCSEHFPGADVCCGETIPGFGQRAPGREKIVVFAPETEPFVRGVGEHFFCREGGAPENHVEGAAVEINDDAKKPNGGFAGAC